MSATTDPLETLDRFATLVADVIARVERLGLLQQDEGVANRFCDMVNLHQELRKRWPTVVNPPATTREELRERVRSLDGPGRLRALASLLGSAKLVAPDARSARRWEKARTAALDELRRLADAVSPPSLPGPSYDAAAWFPWAWSQRGATDWSLIEQACPDLFDFLEGSSPAGWFPADVSEESRHEDIERTAPPFASGDHDDPVADLAQSLPTSADSAEPTAESRPPAVENLSEPAIESAAQDMGPQPIAAPKWAVSGPGSRPTKSIAGTGPRRLSALSDDELASLFVEDAAAAESNADRLLGATKNRSDRRDRDHFIRTAAKAELKKRRNSPKSPVPAPAHPSVGAELILPEPHESIVGRPVVPAHTEETFDPSRPTPAVSVEAAPPTSVVADTPPSTIQASLPSPTSGSEERARESVRLPGFDAFCRENWLGAGECAPAPWTRPGFTDDLDRAAQDATLRGDHHLLELFVRAQQRQNVEPLLFPQDIEVIRRILSATTPAVVGRSEERRERLESAARSNQLTPELRWKVAVLLECLRPSEAAMGQPPNDAVIMAVGLDEAWTGFADQAAAAARRRVDLLEAYGRQKRDRNEAAGAAGIPERRRALRDLYRELYSAAGGKVERTHCRDAWSEFIAVAKPILEPLFPVDAGGTRDEAVDLDAVAQSVRRLPKIHTKIAERGGAKRTDRRAMDKAADTLTEAAQALLEGLRGERNRMSEKQRWLPDPTVVDAVLNRTGDGLEVVRRVVRRQLGLEPATAEGLPIGLWRSHPELLALVEPEMVSEAGSTATAADLSDPVLAAALILRPDRRGVAESRLADVLQTRGLAHLLPRLREPLDDARRESSQRALTDANEKAYEHRGTLQVLYLALDHLGSLYGKRISGPLAESETLIERGGVADVRILVAWLSHLEEAARRALRSEWDGQLEHIAPQLRAELAALVAAENWVEAARRLGQVASPPRVITANRVTLFRSAAASAVGEPAKWLRDQPAHQDLVQRWFDSSTDRNKARALRARFAALVGIDEAVERAAEDITVPSTKVRNTIDQNGMNPCFLPQLAHFGQLRIETFDLAADKSSFPNFAAQQLARPDLGNSLRIALAPRLTKTNREQLLSMLHQKKATAVLVDDLDLCRLVRAKQEEHLTILGVLEIALEQLAIEKVVPFETAEGQHTPAEMFVGREQEARDLATTKTYTRVFSGRKLGKSALLRAVQHRYANKKLPDGKSLRVLYVSLVGASAERDVVDEIVGIARLDLRLDFADVASETPRQRLQRLVAELTRLFPAEFFFFVCDESDQFVETEIRAFEDRRKEDTLSWSMRGLEQHAVRFVFAGYRSTHRNEGVWENWGAPLLLQPLDRAEAESLVVGPLARIGIDASAQGPAIAHRCGYQPAILLRFGRALLDEIRKDSAGFGRDGTPVDAAQVSRAYAHSAVQNEIRTVLMANFHGNPLAQVVFCAALLELTDLPPGTPLHNASDRIVRRIDQLGGGQRWTPAERSPQAVVEEVLGELADRQLLVHGGRGAYQLRIAHHLPVLLDEDPERVIRDHLRSVADGRLDFTHSWKGLLEPGSLDRVRDTLRNAGELNLSALVAGTDWRDALLDRNGLQRALGLESNDARLKVDCEPETALSLIEMREPVVLLGGPELVRWAIACEADPTFEHFLEVVELRRISPAGLGWWLQRARGLEFKDRDALDRIWRRTRGIPDLVGVVDREFVRLKGETLGTSEVEASLEKVDQYLQSGGPSFVNADDRALLTIVVRLADSGLFVESTARAIDFARDLGDALTDPALLGDVGLTREEARLVEDGARLRYLMALGWLPRVNGPTDTFHAVGPIETDDPVRRLLAGA